MDTARVMGSTAQVDAFPVGSFTKYVAVAAALYTKHLNRVRRTKRTALAEPGGDPAAEERWEGEGGNSRNAAVRRHPQV